MNRITEGKKIPEEIIVNGLCINFNTHRIDIHGKEVKLTSTYCYCNEINLCNMLIRINTAR